MSDIEIRDIVETDIENGFLESLDSLRKASDLDREIGKDILKKIIANPDHIIHVAEINGKIIGSTTLKNHLTVQKSRFMKKLGWMNQISN